MCVVQRSYTIDLSLTFNSSTRAALIYLLLLFFLIIFRLVQFDAAIFVVAAMVIIGG